jgi:hypothetical protein
MEFKNSGGAWAAMSAGGNATGQVTFLDSDADTPSGWLVGDGTNVSKTTYSALYAKKKLKHNKSFALGVADYGSDITSTSYAISGGYNTSSPTYPPENAFDNGNPAWISSQTGAGVKGVAYIGQNFGAGNEKHIRKILINQFNGAAYSATSVLVQYSDNGSSWTTADTISSITAYGYYPVAASGAHQYWRLLANSDFETSYAWMVYEIEMYLLGVSTTQVACTLHGCSSGDAVNVWSSGTMYTGLTAESVTYYVRVVDADTLQFHPTANDAINNTNVISLSGGTGTHYIAPDGQFALPNYGTTTINGIPLKYIIKY